MSEHILKVTNLAVAYGRVEAVRGISLEVKAGEFVSVIGSNGAGKSSMLKALARVLKPSGGSILFDGKDVQLCQAHDMVVRGLAMVPEGRHVFADQTIEDNLLLGAYLRNDGKAGIENDLEWVFSLFPILAERHRQDATTLSGGEQQMCAIGRGLMARPKLLMIDELSLGLAPRAVEKLTEALQEVNRRGLTILLVEQDVMTAFDLATHGVVVETGRTTLAGPTAELALHPRVREAYLGI